MMDQDQGRYWYVIIEMGPNRLLSWNTWKLPRSDGAKTFPRGHRAGIRPAIGFKNPAARLSQGGLRRQDGPRIASRFLLPLGKEEFGAEVRLCIGNAIKHNCGSWVIAVGFPFGCRAVGDNHPSMVMPPAQCQSGSIAWCGVASSFW